MTRLLIRRLFKNSMDLFVCSLRSESISFVVVVVVVVVAAASVSDQYTYASSSLTHFFSFPFGFFSFFFLNQSLANDSTNPVTPPCSG